MESPVFGSDATLTDNDAKADFTEIDFTEIDARADEFIRRFQEELKLQRLDHLIAQRLIHDKQDYHLEEILSATNNFSDENLIAKGGLGKVYKGQLMRHGKLMHVVVRRFDHKYGKGDELQTEISMLSSLEHENIISLVGFCDDKNEKIIIYEQAFHGTLKEHLSDPTLTWYRRLHICLGVARALNYIHYDVIHCDINSSKIFLDKDWEPKIFGFELSTKYPQSLEHRFLISRYKSMTPKYDVYSFGVLLLEVLCGRKPMIGDDGVKEDLDAIIHHNLRKQMDTQSLTIFKLMAHNCLSQQLVQRPTMDRIVEGLEYVLELQMKHENLQHSKAADEGTSSNSLKMKLLQIPLSEIRLATEGFKEENVLGSGGFGKVYKAKLDVDIQSLSSMDGKSKDELSKIVKTVAIKRIMERSGEQGFLAEIDLLSSCKHPNIVSLLGYCNEIPEMVLVYEYAFNGCLGDYLGSTRKFNPTWEQRIRIFLDIAHGLNYLHTIVEGKPRIIHRDIKSETFYWMRI